MLRTTFVLFFTIAAAACPPNGAGEGEGEGEAGEGEAEGEGEAGEGEGESSSTFALLIAPPPGGTVIDGAVAGAYNPLGLLELDDDSILLVTAVESGVDAGGEAVVAETGRDIGIFRIAPDGTETHEVFDEGAFDDTVVGFAAHADGSFWLATVGFLIEPPQGAPEPGPPFFRLRHISALGDELAFLEMEGTTPQAAIVARDDGGCIVAAGGVYTGDVEEIAPLMALNASGEIEWMISAPAAGGLVELDDGRVAFGGAFIGDFVELRDAAGPRRVEAAGTNASFLAIVGSIGADALIENAVPIDTTAIAGRIHLSKRGNNIVVASSISGAPTFPGGVTLPSLPRQAPYVALVDDALSTLWVQRFEEGEGTAVAAQSTSAGIAVMGFAVGAIRIDGVELAPNANHATWHLVVDDDGNLLEGGTLNVEGGSQPVAMATRGERSLIAGAAAGTITLATGQSLESAAGAVFVVDDTAFANITP